MAKTEVILIQNVQGLGAESDQVKVAAGYARNYLFPHGMAIPLTAANRRHIEALRKRRSEREAHELSTMTELSQTLSKLPLLIHVKTGEDGKMFGSVTATNIVDELKHQYELTLEKKKVHLPHPIKTVGEHEVELRLHPTITTQLKVRVESTTPGAKPPEVAAAPAAAEGDAGKARGRGPARKETGDRKKPRSAKPEEAA